MGIYRGDKSKDKNQAAEPAAVTPEAPANYYRPELRQADPELAGLDKHRRQHGHDPLTSPSSPFGTTLDQNQKTKSSPSPTPTTSKSGPDGGSYQPASEDPFYDQRQTQARRHGWLQSWGSKTAQSKVKNQLSRRLALGLTGLLGPVFLAGMVMYFALEAGLPTEQVAQAVVGARFSRIHGQMAKRLGHVKDSYQFLQQNPADDIREINRRPRRRHTPLTSRLLGTSNKKIEAGLRNKYKPKYERRPPSFRLRLVSLTDRVTGDKVFNIDDKNTSKARQINNLIANEERRGIRGRFLARRSGLWVAGESGMKMTRFRTAIDKIRQWGQRARGPPSAQDVGELVSNDIANDKTRVRRRVLGLRGLRLGFLSIREKDIDDAAKGWAGVRDRANARIDKTRIGITLKRLAGPSIRVIRGASIVVTAGTLFCTARILLELVRHIAKLQVLQYMDTAANLLTTRSQIRAGDIDYAIVNDYNHRFDGFGNAITYQAIYDSNSVNDHNVRQRLPDAIKYINRRFNVKATLGGLFKAINAVVGAVEAVKDWFVSELEKHGVDLFLRAVGWVTGYDLPSSEEAANTAMNEGCERLLNTWVQVGLAVLFGMLEVALSIATGGVGAAFKTAATVALYAIVFGVAVEAIAGAVNLEEAIIEHMAPDSVEIAAGIRGAISDETRRWY